MFGVWYEKVQPAVHHAPQFDLAKLSSSKRAFTATGVFSLSIRGIEEGKIGLDEIPEMTMNRELTIPLRRAECYPKDGPCFPDKGQVHRGLQEGKLYSRPCSEAQRRFQRDTRRHSGGNIGLSAR